MAVAFVKSSDLVYLPDHGFGGVNGAIAILNQVRKETRRIDISYNNLNPDGLDLLLHGLDRKKSGFSTGGTKWGLKELNLAFNELDDSSLCSVLEYARREVGLTKVMFQGNRITFDKRVDEIVQTLNSGPISFLSLNLNKIPSARMITFFNHLNAPSLTELHLSTCDLGPETAEAIAQYLASSRSRNLVTLELNGNRLGGKGCRRIVDALEGFNHHLLHLGLYANTGKPAIISDEDDVAQVGDVQAVENGMTDEERLKDESILEYTTQNRLPILLKRNDTLRKRIRKAALRTLAPARIILTGRSPNEEEVARSVIHSIGERERIVQFPILDLPREVIYQIVKHTSQDALAFSNEQFAHLLKHVEDTSTLRSARDSFEGKRRVYAKDYDLEDGAGVRADWEVKEEWVKSGGWDRWELDGHVGCLPHEKKNEGRWVKLSL